MIQSTSRSPAGGSRGWRRLIDRVLLASVHLTLAAWCAAMTLSALRAPAPAPRVQPIAALESEFVALSQHLPARGVVGFLDHHERSGAEETVRAWFTAQYALVPRVIVSRTGPEFLIVADGAAHPDGDPRLDGYAHVTTVSGGHRLYRRFPE